jgi:hypothetical protein
VPICYGSEASWSDVLDSTAHFAFLLAVAAGFVSAGLAGNLWWLATGRAPELAMLEEEDLYTPLRIAALIFAAPWLLIHAAFWWFIVYPPLGFPILIAAVGWSFFQGVFILTQVFGLS